MTRSARRIMSRLYHEVEIALWAILLAGVLVFSAFIAPAIPEAQRRAAAVTIHEIAQEDEQLCQRLGKARPTEEHRACLLEVRAFRSMVERRVADALELF